jgi:hypothetical protein
MLTLRSYLERFTTTTWRTWSKRHADISTSPPCQELGNPGMQWLSAHTEADSRYVGYTNHATGATWQAYR